MAYLTKADLSSHLYGDNIDEITRGNDALVEQAITAAVSEASAYLNRYDLSQLFADNPTPNDPALKMKVKDIAAWHLLTLCNANINIDLFQQRYEYAIEKYFIAIMKGQMDPQGWPYKPNDPDTPYNESGGISWASNTKRNNNF